MCRYYELIKSMECNAALIGILEDKTPKQDITDVEMALHILNTPIWSLIDKTSFIGTAWYLPEVPKNIEHHSIASNVAKVINELLSRMQLPLEAEVISVKEKALGYDRGYTIKITRENNKENIYDDALCYVSFKAEVCDVPKKQSNSSGKGMMITDVVCDNSILTFGEMLDIDLKKKTVIEWLKNTAYKKIDECTREINAAIAEGYLHKVKNYTEKLNSYTEKFREQVCKANDLDDIA